MNKNNEITAVMVAKKLNMHYHTAWRRVLKLKERKEITERKPTIGEFCSFYKYDLGIFLNLDNK
jgi:hypothetical protein